MEIHDLRIPEDILPLFDHTQSANGKMALENILSTKLHSADEIRERQAILKGFIANIAIVRDFSYSGIYLHTTLSLTRRIAYEEPISLLDKLGTLVGVEKWKLKGAEISQFILLFNKLHSHYFKRLNCEAFPAKYQKEVNELRDTLNYFEPERYFSVIQNSGLRIRDTFKLHNKIWEYASTGVFERLWVGLFRFEALASIASGILRNQFQFPEISVNKLRLTGFYHPLLSNPVKNNFEPNSCLVMLTGPNMSGKSTALKAIGVCVYLANIGLAIPAEKAEIPLYDVFIVSINKRDDLFSGYSHFMKEVQSLKEVALEARQGKNCFAIFDELFNSTNIEDALEITARTIRGLLRYSTSQFIISTHLSQLKELEVIRDGKVDCLFVSSSVQKQKPVFTYQLDKGWSDLKIGRILFENEGLNDLFEV